MLTWWRDVLSRFRKYCVVSVCFQRYSLVSSLKFSREHFSLSTFGWICRFCMQTKRRENVLHLVCYKYPSRQIELLSHSILRRSCIPLTGEQFFAHKHYSLQMYCHLFKLRDSSKIHINIPASFTSTMNFRGLLLLELLCIRLNNCQHLMHKLTA